MRISAIDGDLSNGATPSARRAPRIRCLVVTRFLASTLARASKMVSLSLRAARPSGQPKIAERVTDVDMRQDTVVIDAIEDCPACRRNSRSDQVLARYIEYDCIGNYGKYSDVVVAGGRERRETGSRGSSINGKTAASGEIASAVRGRKKPR